MSKDKKKKSYLSVFCHIACFRLWDTSNLVKQINGSCNKHQFTVASHLLFMIVPAFPINKKTNETRQMVMWFFYIFNLSCILAYISWKIRLFLSVFVIPLCKEGKLLNSVKLQYVLCILSVSPTEWNILFHSESGAVRLWPVYDGGDVEFYVFVSRSLSSFLFYRLGLRPSLWQFARWVMQKYLTSSGCYPLGLYSDFWNAIYSGLWFARDAEEGGRDAHVHQGKRRKGRNRKSYSKLLGSMFKGFHALFVHSLNC